MLIYKESKYHTDENGVFHRDEPRIWHVGYTAKAIVVDNKFMPIVDDYEWAYKLQYTQIKANVSPKMFVKHFFTDWACQGFGEVFANKICNWVDKHGKTIRKHHGKICNRLAV